jgi:ECF sigma factor
MDQGETHDVTHLLVSWQEGDRHALDELIPLVYQELRRIVMQGGR